MHQILASSGASTAEGIVTAAAAAIAAAATLGAILMRVGRREGKVDEILDRLTKMTERHDDEIRQLWKVRR